MMTPLGANGFPVVVRGDGHPAYDHAAKHRHRVVLERDPNPLRGPKGSPRSAEARVRDAGGAPENRMLASRNTFIA